MQLSVLDQSLIRAGGTAQTALAETLQLARHVERLGYQRFWVSEHHDSTVIAGSSPEVLLAASESVSQIQNGNSPSLSETPTLRIVSLPAAISA